MTIVRLYQELSNTPPPYVQSEEVTITAQEGDMATGQTIVQAQELEQPQEYEDDLLAQIEQINDPDLLKQLLIEKEQERQGLSANLDLAARLGLSLHEQIQRLEQDSSAKIHSLREENLNLHTKVNRSQDLSRQLSVSEHEVKELTGHNRFLQKELDSCRQELKSFRKELDELSEQMAEISTEMLDAKAKVNSYARRLGEVEQELAATQELNVNLQLQLDSALEKQKLSQTNTSQTVKLIQSDLGKVSSDSDSMRITLEQLESRQMKCEGKVMEMMTNTREYAQLLEEAQETIHALRIESDMEGRNWSTSSSSSSHGPRAAIWDHKTGEDPEQHMREIEGAPSPTTPRIKDRPESDLAGDELSGRGSLSKVTGGTSHSSLLRRELAGYSLRQHGKYTHSPMDQDSEDEGGNPTLFMSNQETLAYELATANENGASRYHNTRAHHHVSHRHRDSIDDDLFPSAPQRFSLSADLHQRLEENNILQNVLSGRGSPGGVGIGAGSGAAGNGKPTWSSGSTITHILGLPYSPGAIRDIGKTLLSLANHKGSSSPLSNPTNVVYSPQPMRMSSNSTTATTITTTDGELSMGAGTEAGSSGSGSGSASSGNGTFLNTSSSPGPKRGVVDGRSGVLGLKYLLSATSSADLSNVITKTSTAKTPSNGQSSSLSKDARARWSMTATTGSGNTTTTTTGGSSGIETHTRTSSQPIPIAGGKASSRAGRQSTAATPAASWSATSTLAMMSSISRRPSLPDINSTSPDSD
ncbi:hypothetical protein BGX31_007159 [Mortierella sp. GBA43]|nr:hypothetical protein BGX31_007159 [Mortierella sp. GBA43]